MAATKHTNLTARHAREFLHLYIGQEAIAVDVMQAFLAEDAWEDAVHPLPKKVVGTARYLIKPHN
ncbi:MAG: hypothetical protein COC05_02235 [Gammaproteobacteria bacterium]|nr:MAG: hypothetical protein COC05_02235 [Gammaproteobacteria bacterium]